MSVCVAVVTATAVPTVTVTQRPPAGTASEPLLLVTPSVTGRLTARLAADHHADAGHRGRGNGRREGGRKAGARGGSRPGSLAKGGVPSPGQRDLVRLAVAGRGQAGDRDGPDRVAGRSRRIGAGVGGVQRAGLAGGHGGSASTKAVGREVEAGRKSVDPGEGDEAGDDRRKDALHGNDPAVVVIPEGSASASEANGKRGPSAVRPVRQAT